MAREVLAVARESGHTPAQVALAWLGQRPEPVIPIIGARKLAQVKENLACLGVKLDLGAHRAAWMRSARSTWASHTNFFATDMVRSLTSGGMWDQIDA